MSFHFFAVPTLDPAAAQAELNAFCAEHRVVQVDRQFVAAGPRSHWALCVQVAEGPGPLPDALKVRRGIAAAGGESGARIDRKQRLSETDFARFARLREQRKALAERDGVPVYAVFIIEQLAAMVQNRASALADLQAIDGIGPARLERHGAAMLALLVLSTAPPAP